MKRLFLFLSLCVFLSSAYLSQQQQKQPLKPEEVVEEWFKRWNALDGSEEATSRLVELYLPDAIHQVGPSTKQIGSVVFEGHDAIRKMANDFAQTNADIKFRIEIITANEKSVEMLHTGAGPWGGTGIAVEYVGVYTVRETKKRFTYPGAAFFQILDGKIRRSRLYMARDELGEIRELK